MADDLDAFFNPADGLTTAATIPGLGLNLIGYLSAAGMAYNLDDSGPAVEEYLFECKSFGTFPETVGQTLLIDSSTYSVTKATPDGAGLLALSLFAE